MACGAGAARACAAASGLTSASSSPARKAQADALCPSRRFSSLHPSGPRSDSRLGPRPRVSSAVRPSRQSKPWCGLLELDLESPRLVWRRQFRTLGITAENDRPGATQHARHMVAERLLTY